MGFSAFTQTETETETQTDGIGFYGSTELYEIVQTTTETEADNMPIPSVSVRSMQMHHENSEWVRVYFTVFGSMAVLW